MSVETTIPMNISTLSPNETNLRRIQTASSVLRRICTVLLVAMSIFTVAAIVSMATGHLTSVTFPGETIPYAKLTSVGRIVIGFFALLGAALVIKGLYHLRRLLNNYSQRQIFTIESARQIRHFGFTCAVWGALKFAGAFLPAILLADSSRLFPAEADTLLIGAVIVVISWFAEMAAVLREENDLTI